ncbi:NADPH:quinone reductase [Actinokineospora sp. NBRC 105648]|nr:NADPH:quinone reductase [Actinokineospora sp. NBRC 105648]
MVEKGRLATREVELTRDPAKALVRVEAAGVSAGDGELLQGRFYNQPKFPFVSGYDLVGTVVEGPLAGQRVAAMPRTGSWSSLVQLDPATLVPVPDGLDPADAVALVTNGVTALRMIELAKVRAGQTVLVHGASGGVGMLLTQLAVQRGASVVGTASPAKHEAVRALGATPVDYHGEVRVAADVIFDHLGGKHLVASYGLLNRGGTVVAYGNDSGDKTSGPPILPFLVIAGRVAVWQARRVLGLGRGRRAYLFNVKPDKQFAEDLGTVFASGIRVPVVRYPLKEAETALREHLGRKITGKPVLIP